MEAQSYVVDRSDWYAVDGVSQDYLVDDDDGYCSMYMDSSSQPHIVYSGGSFPALFFSYLAWNGTSWEDETGVEGDPTVGVFGQFESGGDYYMPQVLVGDSETYAFWHDYSTGVNYAVNSGADFGVAAVMPDFDLASNLLDADIDSDNTVHVLFEDDWDFSGSGVYYTTYSGGSWGAVVEVLSSGDGYRPYDGSIDLDEDGNPYVAFSLLDTGSFFINVYYSYDTESGSGVTFGAVEQITESTNSDIWNDYQVIRIDTSGNEYLAWMYHDDDGAETGEEIRFLEKGAGWNESNAVTVDTETNVFTYWDCDMELDTRGVPNIAWARSEYSGDDQIVDVYYTYLDGELFTPKDLALNYNETVYIGMLYLYMDLELSSYDAPYILVSDIYNSGPDNPGDRGNTIYLTKQNVTLQEEEEEPFCGDGNLDTGEECDDGNVIDGDGCDSSCEIELDEFLPETGELPDTASEDQQSEWFAFGVDLVLFGGMLFVSMNIISPKSRIKDFVALTYTSRK
ncbi:MAG: myxococcus cysteine-rich repeat containing protein [Candidatus Dojkabacteria bacterium]|nr:myxococcus cysteine-rich repeat containing protein [Candidatus Dojkabacteria bacterium]